MTTPIEKILEEVQMTPVEDIKDHEEGSLYATHEGKLQIGDIELTVFVLNNGARVIPEDEINKFLTNNL